MNMPFNAFLGATDQAVSFPRQRPGPFDNAVISVGCGRMLGGRRPCGTRSLASIRSAGCGARAIGVKGIARSLDDLCEMISRPDKVSPRHRHRHDVASL
jgi:hypothetical protein